MMKHILKIKINNKIKTLLIINHLSFLELKITQLQIKMKENLILKTEMANLMKK